MSPSQTSFLSKALMIIGFTCLNLLGSLHAFQVSPCQQHHCSGGFPAEDRRRPSSRSSTPLFLSSIPSDDFSATTSTPKPMELPAKTTTIMMQSSTLLSAAELHIGRLGMLAALYLVVNEISTGESMPDQIMDAVQLLSSNL